MDEFFSLFIFCSVFAMAIALYRVTNKALDTMRALERRIVPLALPETDPQRRMEAQLQAMVDHLARLAQTQEATLQALNERVARPRTPVQGVPTAPSAH